jgi:membrane protein implicated in regulation of membrane protease activity
MGISFNVQLVAFNAVSVALLLGSRTLFRRFFMRDATSVRHGVEAVLNSDAVSAIRSGRWLRHVRIDGELWTARSLDGAITEGERVQIENLEGLKLSVRRKQPALLRTLTEEEIR